MRPMLLACAMTAICTATAAQEAGEAYTPGERVELTNTPLPGAEGQAIAIQRVTFAGGWTGERHTHGGPVFVYVLDGEITVELEGQGPTTLSAGGFAAEPMDTAMVARNESATDPVTILLIQVSQEGVPLMTRVE
ncbi:cupin domain-containing protein [Defluviimonas sp. WL0050]|uniref:Cupin domain-containing protein n=1 Tax=Albidovulum litorale TaxID=2984134 RepID=A0ABT2ZQQ7_9RHOB|nr:cupin domain-containing protein [Defluviimonas sp. WL0050]MCV2873458.1 cupin domain-containing protein [Defluviimonas sp. WL0050]